MEKNERDTDEVHGDFVTRDVIKYKYIVQTKQSLKKFYMILI